MKKALILAILAIGVAIAAYVFAADYFEKTALRTRCLELGGVVSRSTGQSRIVLEREWWHKLMPSAANEYPEDQLEDQFGRVEWFNEWKRQNEEHGVGINRHLESVRFDEIIKDGRFKGGLPITFVWHIGVPDADWGERLTYYSVWFYDDQFWRVARLIERNKDDSAGPPPKD